MTRTPTQGLIRKVSIRIGSFSALSISSRLNSNTMAIPVTTPRATLPEMREADSDATSRTSGATFSDSSAAAPDWTSKDMAKALQQ